MELYKYMSAESFEKFIVNGPTIRFTPSKEFNDPFECLPALGREENEDELEYAVRYCIDRFCRDHIEFDISQFDPYIFETKEKMFDKLCTHFHDQLYELRNKYGTFCCSKNNSNILMWSHYADNHKGVAIIFDSSRFRASNDERILFRKVKYKSQRPHISIGSIKEPDVFFTKSSLWKYEEEYRSVENLYTPEVLGLKTIDGKQGICAIQRESISGIIFGCMFKGNIESLRESLIKQGGFEHLKFYKAEMDKREYKLNIVPLEG